MRSGWKNLVGVSAAALPLLYVAFGPGSIRGDEPGLLGRLFRSGGSTSASPPVNSEAPLPPGSTVIGAPSMAPMPAPLGSPMSGTALPAPGAAAVMGAGPRLVPHARISRAATDADPLVTRITLGRSDEGTQFGMFLQVYADGTVIDSEGVHALGREAIKGLVEVLQSGELSRLHGHCGGPPTDFVESVQVVVFERNFVRLRASSFSFSGNPQGCDPAVRRLQSALDGLQARFDRPVSAGPPISGAGAGGGVPVLAPMPLPAGPGIPLTAPVTPTAPPIRLNEEPPGR